MPFISTPPEPPPQRTRFIGREREVELLLELLTMQERVPVTITGPGGIGKTRIAIEAAQRGMKAFPDGVAFVPLDTVDSIDDVVPSILTTLRLEFHGTSGSETEILTGYLEDRTVLLVLDSFAHLMPEVALVEVLAKASSTSRVLLTSLQALGLPGEKTVPVGGLDCPGSDGDDGAALELFETCARRVLPGFQLTWDMKPLAVQILRRLEGNPLGIELAASWLERMSFAQVCHELEQNIASLASTSLQLPERHRSLSRVIEHSWRLLSENERSILEELSIFRGGFTPEAAGAVSGADVPELDALASRSLIRREAEGRFSMQEAARQYGMLRLSDEYPRENQVREKHALFYAGLLLEMESRSEGTDKRQEMALLYTDLENIRSAWKWAVDGRRSDIISDCLLTVYRLYTMRGWFREGSRLFSEALDSLVRASSEPVSSRVVGRLSLRSGWFHVCLGNYSAARELITDSLSVFRALGDEVYESTALNYLSSLCLFEGDYASAEKLARDSIRTLERSEDDRAKGLAWNILGNVFRRRSLYTEAREYYLRSLSFLERTSGEQSMSVCLGNLGIVAAHLDEFEESLRLSMRSLEIVERLGNRRLIAETHCDVANTLRHMNRMEEAGDHYARSLSLNRELGIRSATAITLINIAIYEDLRGNPGKAMRHLEEAYELALKIGRTPIAIQTLNLRGWMELRQHHPGRARKYLLSGLKLFSGTRVTYAVLNVLSGMAVLCLREGSRKRALRIMGYVLSSINSTEVLPEKVQEALDEFDPAPTEEELDCSREETAGTMPSGIIEDILDWLD